MLVVVVVVVVVLLLLKTKFTYFHLLTEGVNHQDHISLHVSMSTRFDCSYGVRDTQDLGYCAHELSWRDGQVELCSWSKVKGKLVAVNGCQLLDAGLYSPGRMNDVAYQELSLMLLLLIVFLQLIAVVKRVMSYLLDTSYLLL